MNKYFLQMMSLSTFILIGLAGSKGVCDLCQQDVYDVCKREMNEEESNCRSLADSVPQQCAFSECLRKCPQFNLSDCYGFMGLDRQSCLRDTSHAQKACYKECFTKNKVPLPNWFKEN